MAVTQGASPVLYTNFQKMAGAGGVTAANVDMGNLFVPLQFFFCRNPGLALPLIALQYHEVKVKVAFSSDYGSGTSGVKIFADYFYLDTDERRRFAQVSHEYLIEQVQSQSWSSTSKDLNFNHPVKELIWHKNFSAEGTANARAVVTMGTLTNTWQLKLNGHDRFAARDTRYFTRVQVWEHHSGAGGLTTTSGVDEGAFVDGIGVYSFALKPEEHQPSGTCNFSRIDNAQLDSSMSGNFTVYAVNYNVLRIMSGMGGLAYSN